MDCITPGKQAVIRYKHPQNPEDRIALRDCIRISNFLPEIGRK